MWNLRVLIQGDLGVEGKTAIRAVRILVTALGAINHVINLVRDHVINLVRGHVITHANLLARNATIGAAQESAVNLSANAWILSLHLSIVVDL